jgi:hypothetical protein
MHETQDDRQLRFRVVNEKIGKPRKTKTEIAPAPTLAFYERRPSQR